jgi:predicted RecA/RadA family phage recombinase
MKNFVQSGAVLRMTAPADVKSGAAVIVGNVFGIACADALEDEPVELQVVGVFTLPKTAGAGIDEGAVVYWDVSASACVAAGGAGNAAIGVCTETAGSPATSVKVRLNGTHITVGT